MVGMVQFLWGWDGSYLEWGLYSQGEAGSTTCGPFLRLKQVQAPTRTTVGPELSQRSSAGLAGDFPLVFLQASASLSLSLLWQEVTTVIQTRQRRGRPRVGTRSIIMWTRFNFLVNSA